MLLSLTFGSIPSSGGYRTRARFWGVKSDMNPSEMASAEYLRAAKRRAPRPPGHLLRPQNGSTQANRMHMRIPELLDRNIPKTTLLQYRHEQTHKMLRTNGESFQILNKCSLIENNKCNRFLKNYNMGTNNPTIAKTRTIAKTSTMLNVMA